MDMQRTKRVLDRMNKATQKELESWGRVENYAQNIHEKPDLQKPIKRPEVKGFKFEQRYNPAAAEIALEWLNSQRWV